MKTELKRAMQKIEKNLKKMKVAGVSEMRSVVGEILEGVAKGKLEVNDIDAIFEASR